MKTSSAAMIAIIALALASCGGKPASSAKTDPEAEKAAALERARHDAFGTQVQALDKAKGMEEDINKKAAAEMDKADQASK